MSEAPSESMSESPSEALSEAPESIRSGQIAIPKLLVAGESQKMITGTALSIVAYARPIADAAISRSIGRSSMPISSHR